MASKKKYSTPKVRKTWVISPISRIKESKKKYNRKKTKNMEY